ncbi:hypothetical protein C0Q70_10487 [Pomacea canaliculata]|uniref:CUB domain-containing protein n=1 Tax=Pomacea canaliculata TaxID=400727 RepID=A0A2T7P3A7_POMCA|nr:hypothetical protein C0Q70_10487 [Pomacea canaliculata]
MAFSRRVSELFISHLRFVCCADCDVTIAAANGAPINATFTSPEYPSFYPNNVHCIYKFIGHEDQRVRIRFNSFALQGRYPT